MRVALIELLALVVMLVWTSFVQAASKAELWARWQKQDPASGQTIDHGAWERFLKQYVVTNHPSGINRVRYQAVAPEDSRGFEDLPAVCKALTISSFNRDEQKAYWINALQCDYGGVDSVTFSGGIDPRHQYFSGTDRARTVGREAVATLKERKLSLDDIEHRILRPIWKDERIHYAVNAPVWAARIFSRRLIPAKMPKRCSSKAPRNLSIIRAACRYKSGKLKVSSIYVWFQEDFGGDAKGLMEHWRNYANPGLSGALEKYQGGLSHDYDWRLNGVDAKP